MNLAIGTKINRWTVEGAPVSRNRRKYYPCKCDCGFEELVRSDNLKSGHSRSHRGCPLANTPIDESVRVEKSWKYKTEDTTEGLFLKSNLLGNFLGPYFIASVAKRDKFGVIYFNCIDEQGNVHIYRTQELHAMYGIEENNSYFKKWYQPSITEHDGTLKEYNGSSGEQAVKQWLINHNISFETEYIFDDLKGEHNCLRFDFKIKNKPIIIEFQGKQHYESIEVFGGEKAFKLQQKYDNLKRIYCKKHNIKLIEIPYNYNTLDEYLNQILVN